MPAPEAVEIDLADDAPESANRDRPAQPVCERATFALAGFLAVWATWTLLDSVVDEYHPYLEVAALGCAAVLGVPWHACARRLYSTAHRKWAAVSETI